MDARAVRTRRRLREAALALAAEGPIDEISVAQLTRAAGMNRATFYKHATSPLHVVREALVDDLDAIRLDFLPAAADPATDLEALWRTAAHTTAAHVARFESIYVRGFAEDASGALPALLSRHITRSMESMLQARPDLLPSHAGADEDLLIASYAAFLGHGLAAILQVWFASGNRDVAVYADAVIGALPEWMRRRTPPTRPTGRPRLSQTSKKVQSQ